MSQEPEISNYQLSHEGKSVPFAIRTMAELEIASGNRSGPPHRHNYFTVIWVKNAKGVHHIDFRDYKIEADRIFFVHPEQVHQINVEKNPDGVVILFTNDFLLNHDINPGFISDLNLFLTCDENKPMVVLPKYRAAFQEITDKIFKEFKSPMVLSSTAISAYLKLFLIECNRIRFITQTFTQGDLRTSRVIRDFKALVEKEFRKHHMVSDFSNQLFVTAKHLNELIKGSTGSTAKKYIQDRITLEAKRMTHFTDLSSKEIAYVLGFNDPAHFSKAFKKCQGMTFSEYKAKIR